MDVSTPRETATGKGSTHHPRATGVFFEVGVPIAAAKKYEPASVFKAYIVAESCGLMGDSLLGALCPSKSGLMNKHIVKHIVGALYPSKSGLMNKHIVKHAFLRGQYFIFGALCPSKSGLMNKHIVKHIVGALYPSKSGLMNKHIVKHIVGRVRVAYASMRT